MIYNGSIAALTVTIAKTIDGRIFGGVNYNPWTQTGGQTASAGASNYLFRYDKPVILVIFNLLFGFWFIISSFTTFEQMVER